MVKKLLILSLAAVMLSTAALANGILLAEATYAAEPEEEAVKITYENIELLKVTQNVSTGNQTISTITWTENRAFNEGSYTTNSVWVLVKANVGKNWDFKSLTFAGNYGKLKGENKGYILPVSKADYDAARSIAGVSGATMNTLAEPVASESSNVKTLVTNHTGSNGSGGDFSLPITASKVTSQHYQDGYLYFAFQIQCPSQSKYNRIYLTEKGLSKWYLTFTGTKVAAPAVDDFSDAEIEYDNTTGAYTIATTTTTGEAYLIIASFTETTMNDVELVTVNAANAEEGVISGTIPQLDEGTIKIFLWDKATLAPATAVQ